MSSTRTATLADVAWPRAGTIQHVLIVVVASFLTGLAAQIAIPISWTPVPITGQTFAVLLSGAVLGARRGFAAQMLYLAEGAMGFPVFAGGMSGPAVFLGPTAGYLAAFPIAAGITGLLCERGWDRRFVTMFLAMLVGSLSIFALGAGWLLRFVPASNVLTLGVLPFVPGDLIKSALAAVAFPAAWRVARRRDAPGGNVS
jgi:biotin transport system substrate-specific component